MAKKALLTIDGTYHKIKKGFLTIDGIYRKVKKAYITIGGVYRPCWSGGGKIEYYGTIKELPFSGAVAAAVSTADWAYFLNADGDSICFYDDSLTYSENQPPELPNMAGTSLKMSVREGMVDGAIFGGDSDFSGEVWAYYNYSRNSGELSVARKEVAAASVGDYALFAGGLTGSSSRTDCVDTVDAFDKSLTRTTPTPLRIDRCRHFSASVGNYALFAGGLSSSQYPYTMSAEVYDASLTRIDNTGIYSPSHQYVATASTKAFAFFAYESEVYAIDKSLTMILAPMLSEEYHTPSGATGIEGFAIFGGGYSDENSHTASVDAYDSSLTRTKMTDLSVGREGVKAASVGSYALFAGGYYATGSDKGKETVELDTVDAYVYAEE